jgi:hypothetical protein
MALGAGSGLCGADNWPLASGCSVSCNRRSGIMAALKFMGDAAIIRGKLEGGFWLIYFPACFSGI